MTDSKTYTGGCHCGRVRYEVKADLSGQLVTCNCSICGRTGAVMTFASPADFTLLQGDDAQTDYLFGKKSIHHLFCTTCGVRSFGRGTNPDGTSSVMINVRCLEGVNVSALKTLEYDGKSL